MNKFIKAILITILFLFFAKNDAYSSENFFETSFSVFYKADEEGFLEASYEIETKNLTTEKYAQSYFLKLTGIKPENLKAFESNKELSVETRNESDGFGIKVYFDQNAVGKGNGHKFKISFIERSVIRKTGSVWEIVLPRISTETTINDIKTEIVVPKSFGELAYVSPDPHEQIQGNESYYFYFSGENLTSESINLAFGDFQVFSFSITYHLDNPLNSVSDIELAIPPDTSFQKVIYESIDPVPLDIHSDEDGNWIAKYTLASRQRLDVKATGYIQLFSTPRKLREESEDYLKKTTMPDLYWESDDEKIKLLADKLQNAYEIYKFVSREFEYNYDRVRPESKRKGALKAISEAPDSICTEFTDTFIAIARAAGIPAREINGYAYTENTQLQPLSLVADVLHSWPEYWDKNKQIWVPIDPTWEKTTNGVDYFNKFDLRHITFVIHGLDSEKPYPPGSYKLGPNPEKDVFIAFSNLPSERNPEISLYSDKIDLKSLTKAKYKIKIINTGYSAAYNKEMKVYFDGEERDVVHLKPIFPFSQEEYSISFSSGLFGSKMPKKITVSVDSTQINIDTNKNMAMLRGVVSIFLLLFIIVFGVFLKYRL